MEELEEVSKEKMQLLNHVEQVTEELEEKTPALQQLRRDYDQALVSNNHLTTKLNTLFEEYETLRLESEDSVRLAKSSERENARLKDLVKDLGRQVKVHAYMEGWELWVRCGDEGGGGRSKSVGEGRSMSC